jgi:hypothetical protein
MFCAHEMARRRLPLVGSLAVATVVATGLSAPLPALAAEPFEIQSLDGSGNNLANPTWGQGGRPCSRVAPARYADGRSAPVTGPNSRAVSNRLGLLLQDIGLEAQYNNDEQIDNQLRGVLFQIPVAGKPPGSNGDDPASLNFARLTDIFGVSFGLTEERDPTVAVRGTTLAARMRALYGTVSNVDAFTGMVAEPHVPGSDLGELRRAIWTREFQRLRDGDRFFYGTNPGFSHIRNTHTGGTPIPAGWILRFVFGEGQVVTDDWNGTTEQDEERIPVRNEPWNASIPAGGSVSGVGFTATWDNVVNNPPARFTLNTTQCATG